MKVDAIFNSNKGLIFDLKKMSDVRCASELDLTNPPEDVTWNEAMA